MQIGGGRWPEVVIFNPEIAREGEEKSLSAINHIGTVFPV